MVSDTDSEVIAVLLKYFWDRAVCVPCSCSYHHVLQISEGETPTFVSITRNAMRQLEGAYALVITSVHFPTEVIGCKLGSPLIVGVKSTVFPEKTQIFLKGKFFSPCFLWPLSFRKERFTEHHIANQKCSSHL